MRINPSIHHFSAAFALICLGTVCSVHGQIHFTGLGANAGFATDVSDDGSVVVGFGNTSLYTGYRWTAATGAAPLSPAPDVIRSSLYISADGKVIAGTDAANSNNPSRGFRLSTASGLQYPDAPAGAIAWGPTGLSSDGKVMAASATFNGGGGAYRWTEDTGMVSIGSLERGYTGTSAISSDGNVIIGAGLTDHGQQAYRWTESTGIVPIGNPSDAAVVAYGLTSDGSTVVGATYSNGQYNAYRWTENEGVVGLANISEFVNTTPFGISDNGAVIVGAFDGGGFIWTPESGIRDILDVLNHEYGISDQTTGWSFLEPLAISANGRYVVGGGNLGGWLLDRGLNAPQIGVGLPPPTEPPSMTPVPEASTYGLLAACLAIGVIARRRRTTGDWVGVGKGFRV